MKRARKSCSIDCISGTSHNKMLKFGYVAREGKPFQSLFIKKWAFRSSWGVRAWSLTFLYLRVAVRKHNARSPSFWSSPSKGLRLWHAARECWVLQEAINEKSLCTQGIDEGGGLLLLPQVRRKRPFTGKRALWRKNQGHHRIPRQILYKSCLMVFSPQSNGRPLILTFPGATVTVIFTKPFFVAI